MGRRRQVEIQIPSFFYLNKNMEVCTRRAPPLIISFKMDRCLQRLLDKTSTLPQNIIKPFACCVQQWGSLSNPNNTQKKKKKSRPIVTYWMWLLCIRNEANQANPPTFFLPPTPPVSPPPSFSPFVGFSWIWSIGGGNYWFVSWFTLGIHTKVGGLWRCSDCCCCVQLD